MGNTLAGLMGSIAVLAVMFLVFLLMREVWCWYWKINAALAELQGIRALLQEMNDRDAARAQSARADGFQVR